ncbi:MAG: hypothetical protein AB7F86_00675 [Bdellovibrionales bacterium]
MKMILSAVALPILVTMSMNAHALLTRCELVFHGTSGAIGLEGGGGKGLSRCWDAVGNKYLTRFEYITLGAGPNLGLCESKVKLSAVGVGFAFDELLTGLGQVEIGSRHFARRSVGAGIRVNPLGTNVSVYLTSSSYRGDLCFGVGGIRGIITTKIGRTHQDPGNGNGRPCSKCGNFTPPKASPTAAVTAPSSQGFYMALPHQSEAPVAR